jgi:hypothetical protein
MVAVLESIGPQSIGLKKNRCCKLFRYLAQQKRFTIQYDHRLLKSAVLAPKSAESSRRLGRVCTDDCKRAHNSGRGGQTFAFQS